MNEEKFLDLQDMGGEYVIAEEFDFDLQRFAPDYTDDTDDTDEEISKTEIEENSAATASFDELVKDLADGRTDNAKEITSSSDDTYTMNDEGNLAVVSANDANIVAGKGNDTVVVQRGASATFDVSKGGADIGIVALSSGKPTRLTFKGYKASTGAGIALGESSTKGIREAMMGGGLTFKNAKMIMKGKISSNSSSQTADDDTLLNAQSSSEKTSSGTVGKAEVTFDANASDTTSTLINLYTQDGDDVQKVGFTGNGGGKLDTSKEKGDFILVGNWDERNYDKSTITGGTGDDTALAGGGDNIDLGAGQNVVRFVADETNRDAATVVISQGRTTIKDSNNSLDDEGDIVQAKDFSNASVSYDENGNLIVKGDGYRGTIESLNADNGVVTQKFSDGSNVYKAAIATEAATIDAGALGANHFQGNNADGTYTVVDFGNVDSAVNIDLTGNSSIGSEAATFKNVKAFQAGESDTTLRGSDGNETLMAGTGNATLYGGGGRNVMNGSADNSDRDGRTTFMVLGDANGAQNTVSGFQFADDVEDNSLADVIEIDTSQNLVSNVFSKDGNVVMDVTNKNGTATERVVVSDAVGKNMYVTDTLVAQVNTTQATYDGNATFFVVTGKNGAITIDNDNVTQANIWLGNQSTNQFRGDIRTIDGRGFDGKAELAGNDLNNTIYGGAGQNSMWGGNGGDDLLIGGTGQNLFFYTNGNGNDTIEGVNEGDVVYLSQVTFENIAGTEFGTSSITLNFNDGGKLTINDEGKGVGMVIGDQTYYVNSERTDFTTNKE